MKATIAVIGVLLFFSLPGSCQQKATQPVTVCVQPTILKITTTQLNQGALNTAYTSALTASGGVTPYHWTISSGSLPTGLNLSDAGVISGTPTQSGNFSFDVTVTDSETTNCGTKVVQQHVTTHIESSL